MCIFNTHSITTLTNNPNKQTIHFKIKYYTYSFSYCIKIQGQPAFIQAISTILDNGPFSVPHGVYTSPDSSTISAVPSDRM